MGASVISCPNDTHSPAPGTWEPLHTSPAHSLSPPPSQSLSLTDSAPDVSHILPSPSDSLLAALTKSSLSRLSVAVDSLLQFVHHHSLKCRPNHAVIQLEIL